MKLIVLCGLLAITFAASGRVQQQWQNDAEPFRAGKQYRYRYDTQISSGMDNQVSSQRISAIAKIHFETERVASLQLQNIQIGSLNQPLDEPSELQSSRLFQEKQIQNEVQSELELPCKFDYVDGVVEGIYFSPKESSWTQNIKRAVLNMLQLNLKRRESKIQQWEQLRSNDDDKTTSQTRTFTLPEVTLEGECQTVYSINKVNDEESSNSQLFNVTKSVDFKHCKNVASIRYGPRAEKPTLESQQQEIEANEVDRSTVFRYQLVGTPEKYGVSRVELLSQYVYKTLNAEHEQPLQTIVVSELCLESVETVGKQTIRVQENQESLLYSTSWDLNEKRFYQYGDEEFTRSPFAKVENKAQIAQNLIRKVAQDSQDKSNGINSQSPLKLQQLVQILRMCSVPELKQIAGRLSESKPEETIFFDALAIAGTRNTIAYLVEATLKEEISTSKAVQALQQLTGLPSPSDKQVEQVLRLCKSEIAKRSGPLRQACWLTAGSLIGDLCKETIYESIEESEKQCPRDVKEKFQKALLAEYKQAETVYEKIVALKALGNAAIDLSVFEIEKIITDQREPSIVRQQAIDALRRLRNQMPRKIQRILLPVFKNVQEQPEVRMTAFSMMMHTLPEKAILDQITFVLFNERSQHVKSFVYTTMKAYSQSPVEVEQEMARHLKSCLKIAKVEQQELRGSRYHRVPIYSQQQQEGLFINWASVFSTNNMLPKHLSISMDAFLNGLLEKNNFEISLTQTDVERYYQQIFSEIYGEETSSSRKSLRGNRRSNSQESGSQLLENVFESLKIQPRRRYRSEESEETPFGMLCLRVRDLDQVILPISEETMPEVIRNWLKGERPSISSIASLLEGQRFRQNTVSSFHERSVKIATTCGLPLVMQHCLPVVASVEGLLKARVQSEGIKIELTIQPMIAAVHSQKMELWCPVINIGVESIRAVETNLPLDIVAAISYDNAEKVKITLRFPEKKTRLVALTSLPITFTREYDSQTQLHREPKIKTVRNPEMESCLVELNSEETTGFSVNGHFHKPSEMTYQQLLAIATITENQIVVEFEPVSDSANGIELTFHGKLFKPTQKTHQPEMSSFYSNKKFENLYEQEMEDYSLESENEREQKLNKYLNKYQPGKIYEHYVKAELQTLGGRKPFKAAADLTAVCDNKWNFCKLSSSVSRSAIHHHENSEWTLTADAQILTPEYVQRLEQLESNQQNKFAVVANAEWGSDKTQKVSLKLQGERAVPQEWSRREWTKMATAFINKYDIVADYKLNEWTCQQFQQYFQLFKIYNYWSMESDEETQGKEGHVFATIVIDPRTRQHLNMTVKAPTQLVRFTNIEMPFSMKPWSLVRHQNARLTDSVSDVVDRVSEYSRDECRVDGKRVKTFDGAAYKAPIHQCYSVIAKDCSNRNNFVVMMKSLEANSEDKKMKIINRDDVYEIEPKSEELIVKINGEKVSADSEQLDDKEIEITDDLVTVKLPQGVTVHFDGRQAVVKMSQMFKNTQCGLCGHYDDDQENEFRTNEDKETDDVKEFHRSYSMLEDSECERRSADKIYEQDSLFGNEKSLSRQNKDDEEDSDYESTFESDEEVENYQIFGKKTTQEDENDDEASPKKVTQVMEYGHKICFSQKPIKQCPKGTYPESTEQVKVQFSCLNRSSTEARRLSREAKNNDISRKVASHKSSFAETVRSHITCSQL